MTPSDSQTPIALKLGTRPGAGARARGARVLERILELDPALVLTQLSVPENPDFDVSEISEHDQRLTAVVREALLRGEIDIAVHAMKDLPGEAPPDVLLAAVPAREDPRDCLVGHTRLSALAPGTSVGVDGPAREAAVRRLRPDLNVVPALGPLARRSERVDRGELGGILVAVAAARRAGLYGKVAEVFGFREVLPSAGQGAAGVEILAAERDLGALLNGLDHLATRWCVLAEREFEHVAVAAGALPVGAYAEVRDMNIHLRARVLRGGEMVQGAEIRSADRLSGLGKALAERLLDPAYRES